MNLVEILHQRAEKHPERAAIIDHHRSSDRIVSFRELADRVSRGAARLHSLGLRKNDTILVFQPVSIELYEILLSAFHSGIRVMLADPSAGREFISLCCQRAKPDAFFGSWKAHALRLAIPEIRRVKIAICSGAWFPGTHSWKSQDAPISPAPLPDDHPALVTFTSGGTGTPKAAVRTHGFLLAQHRALAESMHFEEGEIDLITLPVFVLGNLASGMTSVLANTNLAKPGSPDREAILRQCQTFSVIRCAASPAFFEAFSNQLPPLEKLYTGGAPVFPDLLHRLRQSLPQARIYSVYGSTEAEPISDLPASDYDKTLLEITRKGGGICNGHPVPRINLNLIPNRSGTPIPTLSQTDFDQLILAENQVGEVIVSGEHVLSGYLDGQGDEETKIHVGDTIWHRTGDAGWRDAKGRIWLLGRASELLPAHPSPTGLPAETLRYPFAIESALRTHLPGIRTAAIEFNGKRTLIVQTTQPDPEIETAAKTLGIESLIHLPQIPLDRRHNAKIDYPALRKLLNSR